MDIRSALLAALPPESEIRGALEKKRIGIDVVLRAYWSRHRRLPDGIEPDSEAILAVMEAANVGRTSTKLLRQAQRLCLKANLSFVEWKKIFLLSPCGSGIEAIALESLCATRKTPLDWSLLLDFNIEGQRPSPEIRSAKLELVQPIASENAMRAVASFGDAIFCLQAFADMHDVCLKAYEKMQEHASSYDEWCKLAVLAVGNFYFNVTGIVPKLQIPDRRKRSDLRRFLGEMVSRTDTLEQRLEVYALSPPRWKVRKQAYRLLLQTDIREDGMKTLYQGWFMKEKGRKILRRKLRRDVPGFHELEDAYLHEEEEKEYLEYLTRSGSFPEHKKPRFRRRRMKERAERLAAAVARQATFEECRRNIVDLSAAYAADIPWFRLTLERASTFEECQSLMCLELHGFRRQVLRKMSSLARTPGHWLEMNVWVSCRKDEADVVRALAKYM